MFQINSENNTTFSSQHQSSNLGSNTSYITPVAEITVGHRPFFEQNYVLTDYLEACSVKCPTSSKTVGKSSQIKNQASYNRCHSKLIAYLTATHKADQRPSDDGGPIECYHVTTDDRRLVLIFWCIHWWI